MPINQLNLAEIYGAGERIKGMRAENALAPLREDTLRTQNALLHTQLGQAQQPKPIDPDDLRRAIDWADTPEKWDQAVDVFVSEGRPEFERYRGQFGRREEFKALLAAEAEKADPQSPLGKLARDFEAGLIDEQTYRAAVVKATTSKPLVEVNTGSSGVDYGDPPKDMTWARDAQGKVITKTDPKTGYASPVAVPIVGGPVEQERTQTEEAATAARGQELKQAKIVTEDIDRAITMVSEAKIPITGMGSVLSAVPGTTAHDLGALLKTIKANVGFDKLQAMRKASPTGGALGQVSENENKLLQSVLGSLEQSQSQDEFLYNLRRLKDTYLDIIHGPPEVRNAPQPKRLKYNPQTGEFE